MLIRIEYLIEDGCPHWRVIPEEPDVHPVGWGHTLDEAIRDFEVEYHKLRTNVTHD